jgi:hypothetical protein
MRLSRYRRLLSGLLLSSIGLFVQAQAQAQAQEQPRQQHVGRVLDWSFRHVVLSGGLEAADLNQAKAEPRILFHLAERNLPRAQSRTLREQFYRGGLPVIMWCLG